MKKFLYLLIGALPFVGTAMFGENLSTEIYKAVMRPVANNMLENDSNGVRRQMEQLTIDTHSLLPVTGKPIVDGMTVTKVDVITKNNGPAIGWTGHNLMATVYEITVQWHGSLISKPQSSVFAVTMPTGDSKPTVRLVSTTEPVANGTNDAVRAAGSALKSLFGN